MPMDDRKQRIMMAIVSLYANEGEPVGSNLLSRYFDMAVSSATLRNEMAALTRLGLLEQPHTSAGRVPTAKGYRYYVDNLLHLPGSLVTMPFCGGVHEVIYLYKMHHLFARITGGVKSAGFDQGLNSFLVAHRAGYAKYKIVQ